MAQNQIPLGWEERTGQIKKPGDPYYLNMYTKESQWTVPTTVAEKSNDTLFIACRHLLVKHNQCTTNSSWRQNRITRTKEEAMELITKYKDQIQQGEQSFSALAALVSDCPSAKFGGELGRCRRGMLIKEFEDAAFSLDVEQLSPIVETPCGYHLILRIL